MNDIKKQEREGEIIGVKGRFFGVAVADSGRILSQRFKTFAREYTERGQTYRIAAELRFDDECRNGHETFAITAGGCVWERGAWREAFGGCCHEEIARRFPALAPLIPWHLCSTDGPMHYEANAVYLAGDRDCWGLRKGELRQIHNGKTKVPCWKLEAVGGKLEQYVDAEQCPPAPAFRYVPWNREGEGKARELDAARRVALWPEATDAELMQEPEALCAALRARLPALLERFKAAMIGAGFLWPA